MAEPLLDMVGGVAEHQRRAQLAGQERALLFIDGTDPRTLFVVQHRQADRAGDVILGIFRRAAHIDNGVKSVCEKVGKGSERQGHAFI